MRLGIDLDGVVADFTTGWMAFYNRDFGTTLRVEDSTRWDDMIVLTHFRTIDEFWAWSSDLDGRSVFWHLEPFPGAIEALQDLYRSGHDILIITAKPDFAIDDTHAWVERHHIPASGIHILEEKWEVDCDIYLDDGPYVLPDLLRHRPDRIVCRYVRPWNRPIEGVVDVQSFDAFRALVARSAPVSH